MRVSLLVILFWMQVTIVFAQTNYVSSGTSSNWNAAGSWTPSGVPTATDNVRILAGHTIVQNAGPNGGSVAVNNVTIDVGGRLEMADQKGLTVNGNVVLNGTLEFLDGGNIETPGFIMSGANTTLDGTGTLITQTAINAGQTNAHFRFNANITILSTANLTFTAVDADYNNLVRVDGTRTVNNFGKITINRTLIGVNAASTWINRTGAELSLEGALLATGTLVANESGNIVRYTGSGNQIVKLPSPAQYANLVTSGSGVKTVGGSLTILQQLNNSSILNTSTFDLAISGEWINTGVFQPQSRTVTFNGVGDQTITNNIGESFDNLTVSKSSGQLISTGNILVANNLVLGNSIVNVQSNKLLLGSSTSSTGSLSVGTGFIIGKLERWINSNGVAIDFPISNTSAARRRVSITPDGLVAGGTLLAEFIGTSPSGISNPPLDDAGFDLNNVYHTGFWRLTNANGLSVTQFDAVFTASGFSPFAVDAESRIVSRSTGTTQWLANGSHENAAFTTPLVTRRVITILPGEFALASNSACVQASTSSISGSSTVCVNTSSIYSVTGTAGSTYSWEVIGGTITGGTGSGVTGNPSVRSGVDVTSITVNWNSTGGAGSIQVIENNTASGGCGAGEAKTLSVTKAPVPTSSISGITSVATGETGVLYSVTNNGYDYAWSISGTGHSFTGQGSNAITVNWGTATAGTYTISVVATNNSPCAGVSAAASTLQVTVSDVIQSVGNGNWTQTSTWSPARIPGQFDNVRINAGHTVNVNVDSQSRNLEVVSGAILNLDDQRGLTVNGNLKINGRVEFLDGGNIETNGLVMNGNGTILE
ncbi:MAG: hypothetical protein ACK5OS_16865, partial [Chryseotalea sp.]